MKLHPKISSFMRNYHYARGAKFWDGWRFLRDGETGDCDDFAWSYLKRITKGGWRLFLALLTGKARFWLCVSPHSKRKWYTLGLKRPSHVVLYWRGKGYIDSTNRNWRKTPTPHSRRILLFWPWVIFRVNMGQLVRAFWGKK